MSLVELDNDMTDKNSTHSYLPLYDALLRPIKDTATNILEIGVQRGGSIKLWHDYFTKGVIHGCDWEKLDGWMLYRDSPELRTNSRVVLNLDADAYTEEYVKERFGDKVFDFLLDDGPHTLESQEKFIELYSPLLSDSGILIIEDVQYHDWFEKLEAKTPEHLKKYIKTYDLRKNKDRYDDIVFTIDRVSR